MTIQLKGTKIILSEAPSRDVPDGILVKNTSSQKYISIDAKKGQKEYDFSKFLTASDIVGVAGIGLRKKDEINVYLRTL